MLQALVPLLGAGLGGLAGGAGSQNSQTTVKNLAPASQLENQARTTTGDALSQLLQLVGSGAGQQDVSAGLDSTRSLAALLQQYSQSGGYANTQDMQNAQGYTNQLFAGQQQALNQSSADAMTQANREAARMGRAGNDPILKNKLAQQNFQGQQALEAQKTSFAGQYGQQLSDNRVNYANQLSQVNQGLASQAMANRQALLSAGSSIMQGEQNFRLGSATTTTSQNSGGGLGGFLSGAIAGGGAGIKAIPGLSTIFGGK